MLAFLISTLIAVNALSPLCSSAKSCNIDNSKYLGTWYEIGRTSVIRNSFEKDCNCVKADYTQKPDGKNIIVKNSCVNPTTQTVVPVVGNAKILNNGRFKVSFGDDTVGGRIGKFFQTLLPGPNYVVSNVWVDEEGNYKRALVTYGKILPPSFQFTWILSRDPVVTDDEITEYLAYAKTVGFNPIKAGFERTPCSDDERPLNP
jgi:apolipoprotein D and lipocalin family protein